MALLEEADDVVEEVAEAEKEEAPASERPASKGKAAATPPESEPEEQNGEGSGDEEDEGEVYEIEAIISARKGHFERGEYGYLVKWKDYGEEHNSWVRESDAEGARELINEYWRKKNQASKKQGTVGRVRMSVSKDKSTSPPLETASNAKRGRGKKNAKSVSEDEDASNDDEDEDNGRKKKKKRLGGTSLSGSAAKPTTNGVGKRASLASLNRTDDEDVAMADASATIGEEEDRRPYTTMKALKQSVHKSWEDIVKQVTTVERVGDGLVVYFETVDGKYVREPSKTCAKRFPQKLIEFYESHLRWKMAEDDAGA